MGFFKMINIQMLDTSKTHCLYNIGTSPISKAIQLVSVDDAVKNNFYIPTNQIATHVAILSYQKNDWWLYESHMKTDGVHKQLYSDWIKTERPENVFCFEHDFNLDLMEYFVKFNPGYSMADVARLTINKITSKELFNDNPGYVCSEFDATCDIPTGNSICAYYNKPKHLIKPIHYQMFDPKNKGFFENVIKKAS